MGVYVGRLSWSFRSARRGSAPGLGLAVLLIGSIMAISPATANGWLTRTTAAEPSKEVWAGAEVTASSWSAYSGIMIAPFGSLYANGWRIRAVGGYGAYAYSKYETTIHGDVSFADALIGYHLQLGALTLKAFGGITAEAHRLTPLDLENGLIGADVGAKAALETWLEIGPQAWSSLDLSWSMIYGNTYAARARAGYRIRPELSLGLEGAVNGNAEYDGGRAGTFLRYTWSSGELSAGVGASVDRSGESGGYGSLNALFRY